MGILSVVSVMWFVLLIYCLVCESFFIYQPKFQYDIGYKLASGNIQSRDLELTGKIALKRRIIANSLEGAAIRSLSNYGFLPPDIRKMILKFPGLLSVSESQLENSISFLNSTYQLSPQQIIRLIKKKPVILSKSIVELDLFHQYFWEELEFGKIEFNLFYQLLWQKSYLWDLSNERLQIYKKILLQCYCLSPAEIRTILLHKSCSIFKFDLSLDADKRIDLLTNYLGLASFSTNIKWKRLVKSCPKLLVLPLNYLSTYFEILRQEFQFESSNQQNFQKFIQLSTKNLYFSDLELVRLRCQVSLGFLTNCYCDIRPEIMNEYTSSTIVDKKPFKSELLFYSHFLDYLEKKSDEPFVEREVEKNPYLQFVSAKLLLPCLDIVESALQPFLFINDGSRSELILSLLEHQRMKPMDKDWIDLLLSYWTEMEYLDFPIQTCLTVISRGMLLHYPFRDVLERVGMLAVSLGLTTDEIEHLLKVQPAIMGLSYSRNLYPKFKLLAEAAVRYCCKFEAEKSVTEIQRINQLLMNFRFMNQYFPNSFNSNYDKQSSNTISVLRDSYRNHPIRKKIRNFILQGPTVIVYSLSRFQEGLKNFEKGDNHTWEQLNPLIQRNPHPVV